MSDSRLKQVLYEEMLKLRNGKVGGYLYRILDDMGIRISLSRLFNFREALIRHNTPDKAILASRRYFSENKSQIKAVRDMLYDDESKRVYTSMWKFRCTANYAVLPKNSYKKQYFGNDFFSYHTGETFVDCGAYDGDTAFAFKRLMRKKHIKDFKIIGLEPEENNYRNLIRNHPDIIAIHAGAWDSKTEMYVSMGRDASFLTDKSNGNNEKIKCVKLDDIPECKNATFIKMDIEGAEIPAIHGCRNIIERNHPKLAICIYHSDDDMVKIPLLINKICPEYKLSVRQHSNSNYETVLYAYM